MAEYRDELSEEGKRLWDELDGKVAAIAKKKAAIPPATRTRERVIERVVETDESLRLRLELRKLQQNSRIVVAECLKKVEAHTKKEEYFSANAAKIAGFCHQNFIDRIQRVLDGHSAFDKDIKIDDDES